MEPQTRAERFKAFMGRELALCRTKAEREAVREFLRDMPADSVNRRPPRKSDKRGKFQGGRANVGGPNSTPNKRVDKV